MTPGLEETIDIKVGNDYSEFSVDDHVTSKHLKVS